MKIIRNKYIPFKGFRAINLLGILFVRGNLELDDISINHEAIHTAQYRDLLYVFFLPAYLLEWMIRLVLYRNAHEAYRNISFEQEAYMYERDQGYLQKRKPFAWVKLIK